MPATFSLRVVSLAREVFRGEVQGVYLFGDEGEYEILPFHFPLLGALPEGEIRISNHEPIPLRAGAVLFDDHNHCTIIIEEVAQDEVIKSQTSKAV